MLPQTNLVARLPCFARKGWWPTRKNFWTKGLSVKKTKQILIKHIFCVFLTRADELFPIQLTPICHFLNIFSQRYGMTLENRVNCCKNGLGAQCKKMLVCPDRWEDANQRQVPCGLHRPPAAGTGEGVPLQQIHHHPEEGGASYSTQPIRETGKHHNNRQFIIITFLF